MVSTQPNPIGPDFISNNLPIEVTNNVHLRFKCVHGVLLAQPIGLDFIPNNKNIINF